MNDQLAELECHIAAGTLLPVALAALPVEPSPAPKGSRAGWNIGLVIGLILAVVAMILGIF